MNNNIVFDNDNNSNSNEELLKNNTPNTVDYNKLYNTNTNPTPVNKQQNNTLHDISDEITTINNNNTNIANNSNTITPNNTTKKKKGMDSLLFIFLLFIVIMGIIMFLFPLFSNYLFK